MEQSSSYIVLFVSLGVATLVATLVLLGVWLRKLKRETAALVRRELEGQKTVLIDEMANCFGLESVGMMQVRGNGCLAATDEKILFVMWKPRKKLTIERARITGVEETKWHLGKSKGRTMLKVLFENDQGKQDSVAWLVADLKSWLSELRSS